MTLRTSKTSYSLSSHLELKIYFVTIHVFSVFGMDSELPTQSLGTCGWVPIQADFSGLGTHPEMPWVVWVLSGYLWGPVPSPIILGLTLLFCTYSYFRFLKHEHVICPPKAKF